MARCIYARHLSLTVSISENTELVVSQKQVATSGHRACHPRVVLKREEEEKKGRRRRKKKRRVRKRRRTTTTTWCSNMVVILQTEAEWEV